MQGCKLSKGLAGVCPKDSSCERSADARGSGVFGSSLRAPGEPFNNVHGHLIREACATLQVNPEKFLFPI